MASTCRRSIPTARVPSVLDADRASVAPPLSIARWWGAEEWLPQRDRIVPVRVDRRSLSGVEDDCGERLLDDRRPEDRLTRSQPRSFPYRRRHIAAPEVRLARTEAGYGRLAARQPRQLRLLLDGHRLHA